MFQTFWAYHDLIISDLSLKLKASFESRMARHARLQFCGRITWQHPEALGACSTSSTKVMRAWTCNTGGPRATCGPIVLAHVIELDIPNPVRRKIRKLTAPTICHSRFQHQNANCRLPNDQIRIPLTINFPEAGSWERIAIVQIPEWPARRVSRLASPSPRFQQLGCCDLWIWDRMAVG